MSWNLAIDIRANRINRSIEAYEKYVAKNGELTEEKVREMFDNLGKLAATNQKLYWWSIKVINGWNYKNKRTLIWA